MLFSPVFGVLMCYVNWEYQYVFSVVRIGLGAVTGHL